MTAQARLLGSRYQVGELLGYGGMAEVHRGRDLRLGRDVAIKMLRSDLARDATFQMRFQREAQNAASLNHPAIVSVYDTGEERGPTGETLPYIVMEFVNGRTLKEILGVEGRLMPRRALEITADICAAIEFSHRHGIIHRDIKPGNVMLTQTGQVKVMDFGIARALASGASTMTQTSAVIGTAQYLSPEQARGEAVDARSDVYATGCVLYELLTGHPPFTGDNPVSVAYQHVREDALPPGTANPDVPPDVDAIVMKALAKNPINRYQSAGEMRADLLRAATGRPVYATPVMRAEDMMTTPMRGAAATQVMGGPRQTGTMARVGSPQQRRASGWVLALLALLGILGVIALVVGLFMANRTPTTAVPNLRGLSAADAAAALQKMHLGGTQRNDLSASCDKGKVIDQSPDAGTKVDQNSMVTYTFCAGPNAVPVPDVVGRDKDTATRMLQDAGLRVNLVPKESDKAAGTVISTDPAANTQVPQGSSVTVVYSNGNLVTVPDVTGMTVLDATKKLSSLGFDVNPVTNNNPPPGSTPGTVISQTPTAGETKPKGYTITIVVAGQPATRPPTTQPSTSGTSSPPKPP